MEEIEGVFLALLIVELWAFLGMVSDWCVSSSTGKRCVRLSSAVYYKPRPLVEMLGSLFILLFCFVECTR